MSDLYLSELAKNDLDDIVIYLAEENPAAAKSLLDEFFDQFKLLSDNPDIGHKRSELTDSNVLFWPVRSRYLIIYQSFPTQVEVVRIFSGYRDICSLLRT